MVNAVYYSHPSASGSGTDRWAHIRDVLSIRSWGIGTKELADWQSRDKTPTIYDRRDSAAAIYEIECPPTGRRSAVRLSIDLISRKGGGFYATFLSLLRRCTSPLLFSRAFPSEWVCARFTSKFLLHLPLISFGGITRRSSLQFNMSARNIAIFVLLSIWNLFSYQI